ncbi:hypothetical protein Nmel_014947 [Mimus melanotis]
MKGPVGSLTKASMGCVSCDSERLSLCPEAPCFACAMYSLFQSALSLFH